MKRLTVIGGGPGGYEAAVYAAKCGAEVALVEKGNLGGTCLNVGCIPTKALLAVSDAWNAIQHAKSFGIGVSSPICDYSKAMSRKGEVVSALVKGVEYTVSKSGVRLVRGVGQLIDNRTVHVDLNEGGCEEIESDAIILATGSVPAVPDFLKPDGQTVITSDALLSLPQLPERIIIVGGGVIGCEIGQFLARMGSKVTIVEMLPQLLPTEDEAVSKALGRQFRRDGIQVHTGCGVSELNPEPDGVQVGLTNGSTLRAEKLLVCVGRRPYTAGLHPERAGIRLDKRGFIPVDKGMRTAAKGVYAIGDLVATPQLAHVAVKEGFVAVDNILGGDVYMQYHAVPRCIYTQPQVAAVGTTERALNERECVYRTGRFDFIANGKAKASGCTDGFAKVIVDKDDVLIGAAIVGEHTTEMLQVLTLAVDLGLTAKQVGNSMFPHPTMSEAIMEALHDVHGRSVHKIEP